MCRKPIVKPILFALLAASASDPQVPAPNSVSGRPIPSILLSLAARDASDLREPERSRMLDSLANSFSNPKGTFSAPSILAVLEIEQRSHLRNDLIPETQLPAYSGGHPVDLAIDRYPARSQNELAGALLQGQAKRVVDWYFASQNDDLDGHLLSAFHSAAAAFQPLGGALTLGDVKRYFENHPDTLLTTGMLQQLKVAHTEQAQISEIESRYRARLLSLITRKNPQTNDANVRIAVSQVPAGRPLAPEKVTGFITWSREIASFDQSIAKISTSEQGLVAATRTISRSPAQLRTPEALTHEAVITNLIEDAVGSKTSASQQIKEIKAGDRAADLDPSDKQRLLDALADRKLVEEEAPKVLSHLKDVATIVKGLNAPPEVIKAANDSVTAADTFFKVVGGDYLGAAAGFVTLFANAEPTNDSLAKSLKNIHDTLEQLIDLVNNLDHKLDAIIDKLEIVGMSVDAVKDQTREALELSTGVKYCENLQVRDARFFDAHGRFIDFDARRKHFLEFTTGINSEYLTDCLRGLDLLFGSPDSSVSALFHQAGQNDSEQLEPRQYKYALGLIFDQLPTFKVVGPPERDDRLNALFDRSLDVATLDQLPSIIKQIEEEDKQGATTDRFLPREKYELLSVIAIKKYVTQLLEHHFYPFLVTSGTRINLESPLGIESRLELNPADQQRVYAEIDRARNRLKQAVRIINTAIAQRILLSQSLTLVGLDNALTSFIVPLNLNWASTYLQK